MEHGSQGANFAAGVCEREDANRTREAGGSVWVKAEGAGSGERQGRSEKREARKAKGERRKTKDERRMENGAGSGAKSKARKEKGWSEERDEEQSGKREGPPFCILHSFKSQLDVMGFVR